MRRIAVLMLALAIAACSDNNATAPSAALTGTYTLRTVNGSPLPVTFSDGSVLTSDQLTLFVDGTFTDQAQFSDGSNSIEQGFYSAVNGSITFQDANSNFTFQGSVSGTVLTEISNGITEVFEKN